MLYTGNRTGTEQQGTRNIYIVLHVRTQPFIQSYLNLIQKVGGHMSYDFMEYEGIIVRLADRWHKSLPPTSMYDKIDLVSEGWEVYLNCKRTFENRSKFSTYLYRSVTNRFMKILESEMSSKRSNNRAEFDECLIIPSQISPERKIMIAEAISAISDVSKDFAYMVVNGFPKGLLSLAKRNMRWKKIERGVKTEGGVVFITRDTIETFFGVDLGELKAIVSNYL